MIVASEALQTHALLTREQAAAYLGLKPQTLASWVVRHIQGPPFIKVGRSVRYRRTDLDRWLDSQVVSPGK